MFRETAGDSDGNEVERERGEGEGQQQQEEEEKVTTDSPTAMPVVAESLLTSFIEISGLDPMTASHYLQAAGGDIGLAITLMADSSESNQQSNQQRLSESNSPELNLPYPAIEPFIRQADPIQRDRLIDIRSSSYLAKEREMARREDGSVNWMFPPPRYSNPNPLAEVRKAAKACQKWILVNLQNHMEFTSHLLNRDVWSCESITQHIHSHLIFWQRGSTSPDGKKFLSYYQFAEHELPLVGIIDPRTGALVWAINGSIESADLLSKLLEFEETNKLDSNDPINVRKQNQPQRIHELNQMKLTPTQSDEEQEDDYHYEDEDEEDGDGDEADLKLAMEMSKKPLHSVAEMESECPSVAPTPEASSLPFGTLIREPSASESNTSKISFRLPFTPELSTSTIRRFELSSPVEQLYCYVHSLLPADQKLKKFDLLTPFPRESLHSKSSWTIADANLAGSQIIMKWE